MFCWVAAVSLATAAAGAALSEVAESSGLEALDELLAKNAGLEARHEEQARAVAALRARVAALEVKARATHDDWATLFKLFKISGKVPTIVEGKQSLDPRFAGADSKVNVDAAVKDLDTQTKDWAGTGYPSDFDVDETITSVKKIFSDGPESTSTGDSVGDLILHMLLDVLKLYPDHVSKVTVENLISLLEVSGEKFGAKKTITEKWLQEHSATAYAMEQAVAESWKSACDKIKLINEVLGTILSDIWIEEASKAMQEALYYLDSGLQASQQASAQIKQDNAQVEVTLYHMFDYIFDDLPATIGDRIDVVEEKEKSSITDGAELESLTAKFDAVRASVEPSMEELTTVRAALHQYDDVLNGDEE